MARGELILQLPTDRAFRNARRITIHIPDLAPDEMLEEPELKPAMAGNQARILVDQPVAGPTPEAPAIPKFAQSGVKSGARTKPLVGRAREKRIKQLKKLEDAQLLSEYGGGDELAFYVLFERRQREIFTHCYRMCNADRERASDAFQDTFVKVFTRHELFADATNGRAWLYRIATNTCLNALRYQRRHPTEQLDIGHADADPTVQPDFTTEQQSMRLALERAIASLPMELREPFTLRDLEEFTYEEIAEQLGLSVAACRQRVYRAKQMLREKLKDLVVTRESRDSESNERRDA